MSEVSSAAEQSPGPSSVEMDKTIKTLSNTIATLYEGDLKKLNDKLKEFTDRQEQLGRQIQQSKDFYANQSIWKDAQNLMTSIATCKADLIAIKKDMTSIHSRTKALKKKANDIQDFKLKQLNSPK